MTPDRVVLKGTRSIDSYKDKRCGGLLKIFCLNMMASWYWKHGGFLIYSLFN